MSSESDDLTIGVATNAPTSPQRGRPPSGTFTPLAPGTVMAGRYRIVGLLGRGGMGEVYRADDLTLDQPVALKFLPEAVAADPDRLEQFHSELRIARQISHKNVCRLYDLGEADGRRFLTMEFVDGEDLASLLRRIGRIPHDKAVQIGRQLCAGLAAAHERGVLHRDLKPANVMLDGDGNVRITDFGLAVAAANAKGVLAGTPHYMAPEQLRGEPATVQSDLYALGLILFEIFTGRRAHSANTLDELVDFHSSGSITTPASVVRDLDPAVERVILRCLDRDPAQRPASAVAVAAGLPGGNPLAEALAAGETPSPELVAAAGRAGALSPVVGLVLLAFSILALATMAGVNDRVSLTARIPFDLSLDVLSDRAREMTERFGYTGSVADRARGFAVTAEYLQYVSATDQQQSRWDSLASGRLPTVRFWYRTSPRALVPATSEWGTASADDPPLAVTDMTLVMLDTAGRLVQFEAVPPQMDTAAPIASMNWSMLFEAADLPMQGFTPTTPQWPPYTFADERAAWEGPLPQVANIRVRVEAAAYRGRPVFFRIVGPWTVADRQVQSARTVGARIVGALMSLVIVAVLLAAGLLARRKLQSGSSDLKGASRLAAFVFTTWCIAGIFGARHVTDIPRETNLFLYGFMPSAVASAGVVWVLYVALEPYIRRYSPAMLFSWTRLLAGELRDPRVGRDILIGVAAGTLAGLSRLLVYSLVTPLHEPPPVPRVPRLLFLMDAGDAIRATLTQVPSALIYAAVGALVYVGLRTVTGRRSVAVAATIGFTLLLGVSLSDNPDAALSPIITVAVAMIYGALIVVTVLRFGLLPMTIAIYIGLLTGGIPLTFDMSKTYAMTSLWLSALIAGIAAYGYFASRGGEPLFGPRNRGLES